MEYHVTEIRHRPAEGAQSTCFLLRNSWDDFGFKTTFDVVLFDGNLTRHELGSVRIMRMDMEGGYVEMPDSPFPELDERYCSMGGHANSTYG